MAKSAALALVAPALADAFVTTPAIAQQPANAPAAVARQPAQDAVQSTSSSMAAVSAMGVLAAGAVAMRTNKKSPAQIRHKMQLCAFESELGAQAPTGFWDPAGMCSDGDAAAFRRRRETEIKHGRVSMIACLGYIVPEYYRFPGFCSTSKNLAFTDIPNGLNALSKLPGAGIVQWVIFMGIIEKGILVYDEDRAPGDFEKGGVLGIPNGSTLPDGELKKQKLQSELANGRLAMMAIIGMFFQDGLTGAAWRDWSMYFDSPLRAFESDIGAQAPTGFWDPCGMCADGDALTFRRRKETEIKHGRVAMLACLGYIVPEFYRFPGFCSISKNLAFTDIPNGLNALSKMPIAGIAQWVFFLGICEKGIIVYDPERAPGDFERGGVLGVPNGSSMPEGEAKTYKLNSEIANGRLAMMAIIGMFFQDGLTGAAWRDWSMYFDSPMRN